MFDRCASLLAGQIFSHVGCRLRGQLDIYGFQSFAISQFVSSRSVFLCRLANVYPMRKGRFIKRLHA